MSKAWYFSTNNFSHRQFEFMNVLFSDYKTYELTFTRNVSRYCADLIGNNRSNLNTKAIKQTSQVKKHTTESGFVALILH
jgi:HJR/Mrr/RecB family endonuclease